MYYEWEEKDYKKACMALMQRCQRRMWVYMQPGRSDSEMTEEGIIILRNINGELGRYDTNKQRLVAIRS